jgi:hypothetical protein
MDKSLNYRQASVIRNRGLGDLISRNLMDDRGLGSSIGKAVSDKFKAKVTGVKEKFDPLNIARKLTGNVGATLFGKMTGRSKTDIAHFTGIFGSRNEDPLYTKISDGQNQSVRRGDALADVLARLYNLTKKYHEEDVQHLEMENNFKKEKQAEKEKWQNELLQTITGLGKNVKPTAEKQQEEEKPTALDKLSGAAMSAIEQSIMKSILDKFASIGTITGGALGGSLLAIAGVYAGVKENERVKAEIDKNPNAPGLEDNMYAMTKRGEAKDFREASKKNTDKAVKQFTVQTVNEYVSSDLTDDELKKETGKSRLELQDWLKQNPKGMLKVDPNLRPSKDVVDADNTKKSYSGPMRKLPSGVKPSTAGAGRGIAQLADYERSQTSNTLAEKVQHVINQNIDLKLDEAVAGKTIVIDNSKNINKTTPGLNDYMQPGSVPVRNEDDTIGMCMRKNYRPV